MAEPATPADGTLTIDLAVRALVLATLLAIPLLIVETGYVPPDDALRHAAKAVSGRPWTEIVVLRPDMTLDVHAGWHAFLGAIHAMTGADAHALVLTSIVLLFVLAGLPAAALLRRPEAALAALTVLALADVRGFGRLVSGRPLLVSMAVVSTLALIWPHLRHRFEPRSTVTLVALFAVATAVHGSWFLFLVPLSAFFLAGEVRAGLRVAVCWLGGVALGALATGHPFALLVQAVRHSTLALGGGMPVLWLAVEFQPAQGAPMMVAAVAIAIALRRLREPRAVLWEPVLAMATVGWALGFVVRRFWTDWGAPAALIWLAFEIEQALEASLPPRSVRRLGAAAGIAAVSILVMTSDYEARYSREDPGFLSADNTEQRPWLPQHAGIFYSPDMALFFRTFYANPHAPWRYIAGFEPAVMPPEDFAVFREYARSGGAVASLDPWVGKLRPQDRLVVQGDSYAPPDLPALEWAQPLPGVWSGRLRRQTP
jgi:hypothetical protein